MKRFGIYFCASGTATAGIGRMRRRGGETAAPAEGEDAAETAAVEEAPAEEAAAIEGEVPRNRTMVVAHLTAFAPPEMWSPWALGGTWQNGRRLLS